VLGKVVGTIRGKRVMLHATARVEGDIYHQGIGIEMGTRYDGSLRWTEDFATFQPGMKVGANGEMSAGL
jgi:cytoskeletal protein CcmA (bactofilin family)